MHKKFIILVSLLLMIAIPMSFAADNETVLADDSVNPVSIPVDNGDVLSASNDYYFNASAESDGDGSQSNPYKYLTAERIKANCNIYLADGEYELDSSKSIEKVNIYGSNVEKTIIQYSGVGFTVSSYLTIQNVTFSDMSITNHGNITANNTIFAYGHGSRYDSYGNNFGGAIYSPNGYSNAHVTLNNCTFRHNFAIYGGAIYMGDGYLEVIDTIFDSNMAYNYGGAIACENTKNVVISKSKFYNSISMGDAGGAIYLRNTNFTGKNIEFINSSATFGSAITSLKSTVALTNVNCENNSAKWDGGAIYHMYGDFSLSGSKFTNNSARNGGALYIDNSTSCFVISNMFNDNCASHVGGAIYSILNKLRNPFQVKNTFNDNHAYLENDIFDTDGINLTIGNGNYTMYRVNPTEIDVLPSRYSLIEEGYTTTAKDQETGSNCWAFAAMGVLESCILKANGDALDLSEENMKNLMALYSDYGWVIDVNEGGYNPMPLAYLTSWLGPVLESDDLTDDKSALSPILNSILHVQNILFLNRDNFTDNDAIKKAIIQYGGVGTSIAYYNAYMNSNSYYCYSTMACNHAVTIVGWDDSYSKSNFKGSSSIGDGAWIVKNSWGSDWGNNGYFYVSYYDVNFARPGDGEASYTIIFNDNIKYDNNYQYDISGKTDYFVNSSSSAWYKNVFRATDNEYLAAVSTYFEKVTEWSVSIYVNDELVLVKEGKSNPGYFTIDLDQLIPLKAGDVFEVVFNINVDGEANFPVSERVRFNKLVYGPEMSYVSYDGENWQDLYDLIWEYSSHTYDSAVACIKAFTVLNEIETNLNISVVFDGNPANINAIVRDKYGNLLKSGEVTFNVNEIDYRVDVVNGVATLPYYFTSLQNHIYAMFKGVGYVSSMNYTLFSFDKLRLGFDFNIDRTLNNVTLNIIAKDRINNDALLFIDEKEYSITFADGKYSMNLTNLENGIHNVTLKTAFPLDSIYLNDTLNSSFEINVKNTRIVSNDLVITDDENVTYIVYLFDENDNPLFNKTIDVSIGENVYNATTDINGQASIPIKLTSGIYTAEIRFNGDNDYFASENHSTIEVKCHVLIGADVNQYANNVTLMINVSKCINDTVTVVINNKIEYVDVNKGIGLLNIYNLDNGIYYINIGLNESVYSFDEFSTSFVVDVKNTQIIAGDVVVTDEDAFNYTIRLIDEFNNPLSNKSIEVTIGKDAYNAVTDENGEAIVQIKLNPGVYKSSIEFDGDNHHFKSFNASIIMVKNKVAIDLNVDQFANNVTLALNLSEPLNDTLTIAINNESHEIEIIDGIANLNLVNLKNGLYNYSVYLNECIYDFNEIKSQFVVDVKQTQIIADDIIIVEGDLATFNIALIDENNEPVANRTVEFSLYGTDFTKITDIFGQAEISFYLTAGCHEIKTSFSGDNNHFKSSSTNRIKVKAILDIVLGYGNVLDDYIIQLNSSNPMNETLIVKVNEMAYSITINNFTNSVVINRLPDGVYNVTVSLSGSDDFYLEDITSQFTINTLKSKIISDDLIAYHDVKTNYSIKLVDEDYMPLSDRLIVFTLNGKRTNVWTNDDGKAVFEFKLPVGEYEIAVGYPGDSYEYYGCENVQSISVKSTIIEEDSTTKTYNSQYSVKLLNGDGNPLTDSDVTYIFNDAEFVKSTDSDGCLFVDIMQKPGNYSLIITNPVNNETLIKTINVMPRITQNKDLVMYEYGGNSFKVLVFDDNGNVARAGEIVQMKINGVTYDVKTTSNGYASLKINLKNNKYTVTVSYKGYKVSNKITVKPVLTAKNVSVKKGKVIKFQAKLVNSKGKALKGKKITFKFKGKTYTAITKSNGMATITIKVKLNAGSYKIYSSYGKSKATNTIKIIK